MQELRRNTIIKMLNKNKSVLVSELSDNLSVSEMTIHRDLDYLQSQGILIKKRGGAILNEDGSDTRSNYTYNLVKNLYVKEKRAMGKAAFSLLGANETLIFDNSTSACEVAKLLKDANGMTVIATNPGVFNELAGERGITLYSTGGLYSPQSNSLVGSAAVAFIESIRITTSILGTACISAERGVSESYPSEAVLKRKMIEVSDRTILLVDHTKHNKEGTEKIAELEDIDYIITDSGADEAFVARLREKTKVIVCEV